MISTVTGTNRLESDAALHVLLTAFPRAKRYRYSVALAGRSPVPLRLKAGNQKTWEATDGPDVGGIEYLQSIELLSKFF